MTETRGRRGWVSRIDKVCGVVIAVLGGCGGAAPPQRTSPTEQAQDDIEHSRAALEVARATPWCTISPAVGDRVVFTCDPPTRDACRRFNENVAPEFALSCGSLPTSAEVAANKQARAQAKANESLARCQETVDAGDLRAAKTCWEEHTDAWRVLYPGVDPRVVVPSCLLDAETSFDRLAACVALPEQTDRDVRSKRGCLEEYTRSATICGPLDLHNVRADREKRLDMQAVSERVQVKEAEIRERAAAKTAEETQHRERCVGSNVLQVVLSARTGRDLDPGKLRNCSYTVTLGTIQTTTRDGWMIVTWGENMAAAIKSRTRHADGSYLRTTATATFVGLRTFDRIDGGTTTVAAFTLSE